MKRLISFLVSTAIVIAPLPAVTAEVSPLASGGAAGVRQAQAGGNPPMLWLIGVGATVALGAMMIMNSNGGAIASGTLAAAGNTTVSGQGANGQSGSGPGAMNGGNQSGNGAGAINGGNQSGSDAGIFGLIVSGGGAPPVVTTTTTTTTTGT